MAILKNLVKKNAQRLLSFKIGVVVNLSKRNYSLTTVVVNFYLFIFN